VKTREGKGQRQQIKVKGKLQRQARELTPDIKRSHNISPYSETTSLHSTLRTPSAPIA